MKYMKIKGKREPIAIAEWNDIKHIVKADLIKERHFFEELAQL